MHEALFYEPLDNNRVHCTLCPHDCRVGEGRVGVCGVRKNENGKLYSLIYGQVSSIHNDPIEKKPLYHFHPGTFCLSIGTLGCNMRCGHCQNWQISHVKLGKDIEDIEGTEYISPEELIKIAEMQKSAGIAWTYNEPTIWIEYALDGMKLAKKHKLYTVFVTNGYITPEALDAVGPYLEAYRVDVKGFTKELYRKLCKIPDFQPVLDAAERAKKKWQMHVEIVTNIIPTLNDDEQQLRDIAGWIKNSLGADTPWHVTRFFPYLEYQHLPPTPIETIDRAVEIGKAEGLRHVYRGNV